MKKIIYVFAIAFFSSNAYAQQDAVSNTHETTIEGLKASVTGTNLLINWGGAKLTGNEYWEVQASNDGKQFTQIGLVLGADPKVGERNYSFKNNITGTQRGMKFYRVLKIQTETSAFVSNSILVAK